MSDLIQTVTEGVIEQTKKNNSENRPKNELGKDAFLQLLVTQMKYQDPLNPNTDTEYIAQLATFSQLEQMQNLSTISTNSQAFALVGREVIVKTETATGDSKYVSGRVDFVNMSGGKAQMSINGQLYPVDKLDSVIDDIYILEKGLPGVKDKTVLEFDADNPKDMTFAVKMGEGDTVANNVGIVMGDALLDASLISVKESKVTIKKEAFANLPDGTYKLTVVFNDAYYTTVKDKVTVTVKNSEITAGEETGPTEDETDTTEQNKDTTGGEMI